MIVNNTVQSIILNIRGTKLKKKKSQEKDLKRDFINEKKYFTVGEILFIKRMNDRIFQANLKTKTYLNLCPFHSLPKTHFVQSQCLFSISKY